MLRSLPLASSATTASAAEANHPTDDEIAGSSVHTGEAATLPAKEPATGARGCAVEEAGERSPMEGQ
eukprot:CAMPEP_0183569034 /NCGR_PEP_ID=MMETSP0371-20130417/119101_1 /TAXON_ID=268820 /ORGANISM="Peridinium aciculiferum, Strain PAER-2" /LENGTH=66 /DNA_ID=CAMNT_0025778579 /DNA_START=185 /DNA_END=385 /DNA_ORIENTATION=-